jgi:hypothetical protein
LLFQIRGLNSNLDFENKSRRGPQLAGLHKLAGTGMDGSLARFVRDAEGWAAVRPDRVTIPTYLSGCPDRRVGVPWLGAWALFGAEKVRSRRGQAFTARCRCIRWNELDFSA